jgi:nitrogen-specific signal transduction histidine kinase
VTESAPDGIIVIDSDGHIVLVDRGFERLLGYTRKELVGLPVQAVLLPSSQSGSDLRLARRKDGSEIQLETALHPLHGDATLVRAFVQAAGATQSTRRRPHGKLVGELTDAVAHDLNNILTILRAEVSLLEIEAGQEQNKSTARIDNALDRATELARRLVTIGHIARLPENNGGGRTHLADQALGSAERRADGTRRDA